MVGKDNPGVDVERSAASGFPNRVAQCVDPPHQQIRMTVEQVHREEECSARNPIAAIIRHQGSMHGLGERRNALTLFRPTPLKLDSRGPSPAKTKTGEPLLFL